MHNFRLAKYIVQLNGKKINKTVITLLKNLKMSEQNKMIY